MTGTEYSEGDSADANLFGWRHFKKTTLKFKILKSTVPLFLFVALISQWYISYYVEDYYAHKPKQQGLNLDEIKSHVLVLSDKTIMGFNFADLQNLLTFNCKK